MSPLLQKKPPHKPNRPSSGQGRRPPIPGKTAGFWILLVLLVFIAFQMMYIDRRSLHEISYSSFKEQVEVSNISSLVKTGMTVEGEFHEETPSPIGSGSTTLRPSSRASPRRSTGCPPSSPTTCRSW
jgi:hypothetical protein